MVSERDSSWPSWSASRPTRSSTLEDPGLGGTQKDEPGTKGSQSGVAFWTMMRWIRSSSFFSNKDSGSPSPSSDDDVDDDDEEDEEEEEASRSISIRVPELLEKERWAWVRYCGRKRRDRRSRLWIRIRAIGEETENWEEFFGCLSVYIYI